MRGPDFHKRNMQYWVGPVKRFRRKGKAAGQERRLVAQELADFRANGTWEQVQAEWEEMDLAYYCYRFGPCPACKAAERAEEDKA